jgi:hypothetical protein
MKNRKYVTPNGLILSFGSDKNGNKTVKITPKNYSSFSVQTNGSLPLCSWERMEDLTAVENELAYYITRYGTVAQRKAFFLTVPLTCDSDFEVVFDSNNGIYNLIEVCLMSKRFGMKNSITRNTNPYGTKADLLCELAESAERYINQFLPSTHCFGCTENADWVIATKDNECWG